MSTASPESHQLHLAESQIIQKAPVGSPELAQMTNVVNVLDLHKDFANETKIYDKATNTVYVYSSAPPKIDESSAASSASPELSQQLSPQQMQQVVINQHPSDLSIDNALKNGSDHYGLMAAEAAESTSNFAGGAGNIMRIVNDNGEQILTKVHTNDDSFLRLIESNQIVSKLVGENQQIIRRDIVNGEHHIITRNENGEHILTRIVSTNPGMDHGKITNGNEIFNSLAHKAIVDDGKTTPTQQIIYTTATAAHETNGGVIKHPPQPYDTLNPDVQKQIDLIYDDGNKTVIYTTAAAVAAASSAQDGSQSPADDDDGEDKGLELYSTADLNGTQVIVQGNLQYTPQIQPDGSTVYVVSELVSHADLGNGAR
jgi:hypothetical protein